LNKTVSDADTVGTKLPQYCGSWGEKTESTEAVGIILWRYSCR